MKKMIKLFGLTYCLLNMNTANTAYAAAQEAALDAPGEQIERSSESERPGDNCRLFYVKNDLGLQLAGMEEREPISTLHFFVASLDGKILNDAQVIVTVRDSQGENHMARALPLKSGYTLDIAPYPAGKYLAEVEIVAEQQFLTKVFRFSKV